MNDDGSIDMADISIEIDNFMRHGTPIDKTALLLKLESEVNSLNTSLIDLQNHIAILEEKQDYVKTIRFYTPNETLNNQTDWKDAAVFEWTPQNATNNAILQGSCYFQYLTPDVTNIQLVWRILINDFEVGRDSVVNHTTEYQQSPIFPLASMYILMPDQSTCTVKFQIKCAANYPNPVYAKDVNILLEVMDGLPPN